MQPAKRYACFDKTSRFTYHTKQSVVAMHEIGAHTEQQERAGTIRAFDFTLSKALVTDERALVVANETTNGTKWYTLGARTPDIRIHLARRDKTRKNRFPYAKK